MTLKQQNDEIEAIGKKIALSLTDYIRNGIDNGFSQNPSAQKIERMLQGKECAAPIIIAEILRQNAELVQKVENLTAIVESVAHIGVDFGHGPYQLTEEHAKLARELLEDD